MFALTLLLFYIYVGGGDCTTCKDFVATNLPCVDVPACGSTSLGKLKINKLSNGLAASSSTSDVEICHNESDLKIKIISLQQKYYSNHEFSDCNDSIFNSDIAEVFIAPWFKNEPDPHCYSEIDVSPSNKLFESGIYNPNLNHTGVSNYLFDCATSGVKHSTFSSLSNGIWTEDLSIPWSVINHPYGCPSTGATSTEVKANGVYRANFFRVNELVPTDTCSSTSCEYMAWSPTGSNPPAFHEPTKFGYLVLL